MLMVLLILMLGRLNFEFDKKKQIEIIQRFTPEELKGRQIRLYAMLGFFRPSAVNWSYVVGYVLYRGVYVLVVTRLGEIL